MTTTYLIALSNGLAEPLKETCHYIETTESITEGSLSSHLVCTRCNNEATDTWDDTSYCKLHFWIEENANS